MTQPSATDSETPAPGIKLPATDTPREPNVTGFERVSRQVRRRTTDIMAIAVVLIAGLTFGRQIVEWRRADSIDNAAPAASALSEAPWGKDGSPVSLEFGDEAMSITRRELFGPRENAISALVAGCRQALENKTTQAISPVSRELEPQASALPQPPGTEQFLLDAIAGMTPSEEQPGKWRIYQVDNPFLLVVGVRTATNLENADNSSPVAQPPLPPRVVCWGLGVPLAEGRWTVYLCGAGGTASAPAAMPVVPLPPGSRRLLGLRDQDGGALVGFAGESSPKVWIQFYDTWFAEHGWQVVEQWQGTGQSWAGRFQAPAPYHGMVEIYIHQDGAGKLQGMQNVLSAGPLIQERGE